MTEEMSKKDRAFMVLGFLLIVAQMAVPIAFIHLNGSVDELGILSHPALLAGHNWTDAVHCEGDFYYKYGTVLIYALPFQFIKNTVVLYRVLILLNAVCVGVTAPIAYLVCRKYMGIADSVNAFFFSLVCTGTPVALFQCLYCRGDFVMVFIPWVVLIFLLEANAAGTGGRKILFSVLSAVAAMYAYMSHTRGIVMVIALFLTIVCARLFFKLRPVNFPAYLAATVVTGAVDRVLTAYFKEAIYGVYGAGHASVDALDLSALVKIFTPAGFSVLLRSVAGWLLSVFAGTMGLVVIGLIAAFFILIAALRKRTGMRESEVLTALLGLLNFMGTMGLGLLFFYPYLYSNFEGTYLKRGDHIIYERYMVGTLGILCLLGLCLMLGDRVRLGWKTRLISCVIFAGMTAVFYFTIGPVMDELSLVRKFGSALDIAHGFLDTNALDMTISALTCLGAMVFWVLLMRWRKGRLSLLVILCAFLVVLAWNSKRLRLSSDKRDYAKAVEAYEMLDSLREVSDEYPNVFLEYGSRPARQYQQLLVDFNVIDHDIDDWEEMDNLFIVSHSRFEDYDVWADRIYTIDTFDYSDSGEDHVYVVGEELKDRLEMMGYKLTGAAAAEAA